MREMVQDESLEPGGYVGEELKPAEGILVGIVLGIALWGLIALMAVGFMHLLW